MLDTMNPENALMMFTEMLNRLEQTDKQEFERLAGLTREAVEHIGEQEHFHRLLHAMPEDFALALCRFVLAVLLPALSGEALEHLSE